MDTSKKDESPDLTDSAKRSTQTTRVSRISRQFWQAGELLPEINDPPEARSDKAGLDHARLHPRFLHSNATSHKWALGAFVELLDNSMDEVDAGTTAPLLIPVLTEGVDAGCNYVNVDKIEHPVEGDQNPMLLVEDNGGGMDASTIRNCMSFGFSLKHGKKMIGQYGNGFKTSTMRLGADALVLTKSAGSQTCSIGLLSYTFLTETNSQDVVVPIIDYNLQDRTKMTRGDENDWNSKLSIICNWGPFASEMEIWNQLDDMPTQGTRVYIWNLWQTSDDLLELDFETDLHDIRLRGSEEDSSETSNRKKRSDEGIRRCHAYKHSLRSYVSLLYLQWPEGFQVMLRGKEIRPVPVTAGMKHVMMYDYKPRSLPKDDATPSADVKGPVVVPVYIGFAVEAPETSVSGFCVYHRNRLIKPFWKVYTSASSVGRGVIGFLQVDFVEPAHDKQDFENTPPLQKLEKYLKRQVPHYWRSKAHLVGYQDHLPAKNDNASGQEVFPNAKKVSNPTSNSLSVPESLTRSEETPHSISPEGATPMSKASLESNPKTPTRKASSVLSRQTNGGDHEHSEKAEDQKQTRQQQKTPSKLFQEMQQQISQLQKTVQDFCYKHDIKEDAQMVLGRIFGTTMSKLLDPAKDLKRMHLAQVKLFRNVLHYIAEMKSTMSLTGEIPKFILTEMQAIGIQIEESKPLEGNGNLMEIEQDPETQNVDQEGKTNNLQPRTSKRKANLAVESDIMKKEKKEVTDATMIIDNIVQIENSTMQVIAPEEVVPLQRSSESFLPQRREVVEATPTRKQKTEQSNQELARLGLSVMEKFLKTAPNKMEIVQIQPMSGTDLPSVELMHIGDVTKTSQVTIDCCTPDKKEENQSKDNSVEEEKSSEPTIIIE